MKYCAFCGGRLEDNDKFCPYCGQKAIEYLDDLEGYSIPTEEQPQPIIEDNKVEEIQEEAAPVAMPPIEIEEEISRDVLEAEEAPIEVASEEPVEIVEETPVEESVEIVEEETLEEVPEEISEEPVVEIPEEIITEPVEEIKEEEPVEIVETTPIEEVPLYAETEEIILDEPVPEQSEPEEMETEEEEVSSIEELADTLLENEEPIELQEEHFELKEEPLVNEEIEEIKEEPAPVISKEPAPEKTSDNIAEPSKEESQILEEPEEVKKGGIIVPCICGFISIIASVATLFIHHYIATIAVGVLVLFNFVNAIRIIANKKVGGFAKVLNVAILIMMIGAIVLLLVGYFGEMPGGR